MATEVPAVAATRRFPWFAEVLQAAAVAGCGGDSAKQRRADPPGRERAPAPRTDPEAIAARSKIPVLAYHQIRPLAAAVRGCA